MDKTTENRIEQDAIKKYPLTASHTHTDGPRSGYIAGATAENERAQKMAEVLDNIGNGPFPITQKELEEWLLKTKSIAREALEQWRGSGKEVGDESKCRCVQPNWNAFTGKCLTCGKS